MSVSSYVGLVRARVGVAPTARQIYLAAAVGGMGGGLALAYATLLHNAASHATQQTQSDIVPPPRGDGIYGNGAGAPAHAVVMMGDSTAYGVGVHSTEDTPGALLASTLAARTGTRVALTVAAESGATSAALETQVDAVLAAPATPGVKRVAVIMIGANDVRRKKEITFADSVRYLNQAVGRLRAAEIAVVVGTCPDLGTVRLLKPHMRVIARRWSRQLAAAQTIAVVKAGGRTVSIGDLLGPEFSARPNELFGEDKFHPSAEGYRAATRFLEPAVAAALGYGEVSELTLVTSPKSTHGTARVAATAAENPGTEVRERGQGEEAAGWFGRMVAWASTRPQPRSSGDTSGSAPADAEVSTPQ